MPSENFIKNLTSKDISLSKKALNLLIQAENDEYFNLLCEKSDFIFPFIKERIIKDFVKNINKENLSVVFKYSKIYSSDFEDLIVNSWLKFACEDLTDEILELFEIGTKEQKTYCAKYFSKINDLIALDTIKSYAFDEFSPLKINCAKALMAFDDKSKLSEAKEIVLKSNDDFEINSAFEFICAYTNKESIEFVVENAFDNPFCENIITNLLDNIDFNSLKNYLNENKISRIYQCLLEGYPEDISLDTIQYYQIYDFIEYLEKIDNQYAKNLLILSQIKFQEFARNDIYTYDLDKNTKEELSVIVEKLENIKTDYSQMQQELKTYNIEQYRYLTALEVLIANKDDSFCEFLADLINSSLIQNELLAKTAQVLKELNKISLINKDAIEQIENINIRALVLSYL